MSEVEIPRWDIVPERPLQGSLPVSSHPNEGWCAMVNFMYGSNGYQTQLMADRYLIATLDETGQPNPGVYQPATVKSFTGEQEKHTFVGLFMGIDMMADLMKADQSGCVQKLPFVRLESASDLDSGEQLCRRVGQQLLLPLINSDSLFFERM